MNASTGTPVAHRRSTLARGCCRRFLGAVVFLLLLTSACGDAFFNLSIVNRRHEPVLVAISDSYGPRMSFEVGACQIHGPGTIAYAPGEPITVTVLAEPSRASLLTRTISPKSTPRSDLPSFTLEVPAASEGECASPGGRPAPTAGSNSG